MGKRENIVIGLERYLIVPVMALLSTLKGLRSGCSK